MSECKNTLLKKVLQWLNLFDKGNFRTSITILTHYDNSDNVNQTLIDKLD